MEKKELFTSLPQKKLHIKRVHMLFVPITVRHRLEKMCLQRIEWDINGVSTLKAKSHYFDKEGF